MTQSKRIVLNAAATYARSLYKLVVGLFCGRWALMALGQSDYGLYGLIGGMTAFVTFFNGLLSFAVGRFYGVAVGSAKREGNAVEGLEECRRWFNTALSLHSVVSTILAAIAVSFFFTFRNDRVREEPAP